MSLNPQNKLVGTLGTFLVNNTTVKNVYFDALIVIEDCVFSFIKTNTTDRKSVYIANSTATIKAGTYISFGSVSCTSIQLVSGSVNLVLSA